MAGVLVCVRKCSDMQAACRWPNHQWIASLPAESFCTSCLLTFQFTADCFRLCRFPVRWQFMNDGSLKNISAWVSKKVPELVGMEEPDLVEFIMSLVRAHAMAGEWRQGLGVVHNRADERWFVDSLCGVCCYWVVSSSSRYGYCAFIACAKGQLVEQQQDVLCHCSIRSVPFHVSSQVPWCCCSTAITQIRPFSCRMLSLKPILVLQLHV